MADEELKIKKLVEAVEKDEKLRAEFFRAPEAFAERFEVKLGPEEVAQVKRVGALMQLVDEFKAGRTGIVPGPIFYPIDIWWKRAIRNHVVSYRPIYYPLFYHLYYHIFYPIGYPIGPIWERFRGMPGMLRRR